MLGTSMLWVEGQISSYFLPEKMSIPTKCTCISTKDGQWWAVSLFGCEAKGQTVSASIKPCRDSWRKNWFAGKKFLPGVFGWGWKVCRNCADSSCCQPFKPKEVYVFAAFCWQHVTEIEGLPWVACIITCHTKNVHYLLKRDTRPAASRWLQKFK